MVRPHFCLVQLEWKAGIDGKRTHLDLGFEQIPGQRAPSLTGSCIRVTRRDQTPLQNQHPKDQMAKVQSSRANGIVRLWTLILCSWTLIYES